MEQQTEHKWKRRRRRERRIKIAVLSAAAICVVFGTTMALSAAQKEEQIKKVDSAQPQDSSDTVPDIRAVPENTPVITETPVVKDNPKKKPEKTGWYQTDDIWYYLNEDGSNAIGWIQPDGSTWYYLNEEGAMMTGWIQLAEGWYYLHSDGSMATGWICDEDGHNYFLQENGLWIKDAIPDTDKTNGNYEGPLVALTFDDGPGAYTGRLLDSLEKYGARATFFMLGEQVVQYPEEIRRMDALGCEIGNHSYDHADLTSLDNTGVQIEFGQTNQELIQIIGRGASVARPPYASMNQEVLDNIGMPSIIWSIDTLDWQTMNAQATIDTVLNQVTDGDIILMHDIHQTSVQAAESLIPALIDRGYTLVTVSELASIRGVTLQPGNTYGSFK